jgi:hypothetical protein
MIIARYYAIFANIIDDYQFVAYRASSARADKNLKKQEG